MSTTIRDTVWVARNRLTTARILYRIPDHLSILQEFVWQDYDHVPDYPALHKFLKFWDDTLDGPIYSVAVADSIVRDEDFRYSEHMIHRTH
jgi:uncharacterized protein Usg